MAMISSDLNAMRIGHPALYGTLTLGDSVTVDDAAEKAAFRFNPAITNEITAVDLVLQYYGNTSGVTFQVGIYDDSGGAPNALIAGASATFSGEASATTKWAGGGTNPITLGAGTGALTVNVPYWLVLEVTAGSLDGTNYVKTKRLGQQYSRSHTRLYTSGAWGSANTTVQGLFVLKHGTTGVEGFPIIDGTSGATNPGSDIYDANRCGLKFRVGSKMVLRGIMARLDVDPTPQDLVLEIYNGSTLVTSSQFAVATIEDSGSNILMLSSPPTLDADTDYYAILLQKGSTAANDDGGDGSNDYRLWGSTIPAAYWQCLFPAEWYYVYGTGNDPTALTAVQTWIPMMLPIIADWTTDLDSAAGGGPVRIMSPVVSGGNVLSI